MARRHMYGTMGIILCLCGFYVSLSGCQKATPAKPLSGKSKTEAAIPVRITPVEKATFSVSLSATGSIYPIKEAVIGPRISGFIQKIYVDEGDEVRAGDKLLQLDTTNLTLALNQAAASVKVAEANLRQARTHLDNTKKEWDRMVKLYEKQVISQEKFDQIDNSYTMAQSQVETAVAQVNQARESHRTSAQQLKDATLLAPFPGIIVKRTAHEGEMANSGQEVFHLMNTSQVKVEGELPEQDLALVKEGTSVNIKLDAYPDLSFQGRVDLVGPTVDFVTRTFRIRIIADNPDRQIKPGMFARLELCPEQEYGLSIPAETIIKDSVGTAFVFVADKGIAARRMIAVGRRNGPLVEVLQGLSEGEKIVVAGQDKLKDGQKVEVVEKGAGV
ncbi:MAG: efflux RND transporter periplasmic adaptor subunit [bacterium]